ncbi:MAG: iron ABC transporter permease [Dehalococcoidia bacterium]|nr:iron ABC transporter permease [Dehalococcoidia bacterium]
MAFAVLSHRRGRRRPAPAALWLPGLAVVIVTLLPFWYLWKRSTERGWSAWDETLSRSATELLANSAKLSLGVAVICVAVALPAAWLTVRTDLPFRRAWSVLLALPLAIPSYVMGMTVVAALGPKGMLQGWLEPLGVDRLPEIYGYWGALLTLGAVSFPYVYLVLRAALRTLDPFEEEASRSLGRGPWSTFAAVSVPALIPAIAAGLLLVALYVLSDFGGVATLKYNTFTRAIFIEYSSSFDRTGAAILGVVLAGLAALLLAGELFARSRYQARARAKRLSPARPIALGRWRWPAVAFLAAVVAISLVLPMGVLVYWLVKGIRAGADFPEVWEPLRHSATMAASGGVVTVLLALPIALLAARFGGPLARLLEQAAFATHALPGLVVALALVFFGIGYATELYQTTWMLLVAYVILFLPNALGALRAPLMRQSPHLEEAAAGLGRRPLAAIASITLPLARPGAVAAFALVFLTIMKELPATLLLSPPGYRTLPGVVWSNSSEALYGGAALPALILVGVAAVPLVLLVWRGDLDAVES